MIWHLPKSSECLWNIITTISHSPLCAGLLGSWINTHKDSAAKKLSLPVMNICNLTEFVEFPRSSFTALTTDPRFVFVLLVRSTNQYSRGGVYNSEFFFFQLYILFFFSSYILFILKTISLKLLAVLVEMQPRMRFAFWIIQNRNFLGSIPNLFQLQVIFPGFPSSHNPTMTCAVAAQSILH